MGWSDTYWQKNRKKILEDRRKKYANDPEFREDARRRAQEYRDKKRAEREAFIADPYIEIDGKRVKAYTGKQLCAAFGLEEKRLRYLQKAGYLPQALVLRPERLYTKRQADLIVGLHHFLQENSGLLRVSDADAKAKLDARLSTMQEQWETP